MRATIQGMVFDYFGLMKRNMCFPALSLVLILASFYSFVLPQPGGDEIYWRKGIKLTWDDFQAEPNLKSGHTAVTSSRIKQNIYYGGNDSVSVAINACFLPNKSWVAFYGKEDSILQHEQLHFDICELHARKFRKIVADSTFSNVDIRNSLVNILNQIWLDLDAMEKLYDQETKRSMDRNKQKEWEIKIEKELKELEQYEYKLIYIKRKK